MSEPWTPGPWRYEQSEDACHVYSDNGEVAHFVTYAEPQTTQLRNDARLIALAPEMAELLDELARGWANVEEHTVLASKARAFLARARGEDA